MKIAHLLFTAAIAATSLTACTPTYNVRGNMLEDSQLVSIQPGIDTPTTKSAFDDKTWYYIGQDTKKRGILDPKVTKERIVEIHFNEQGIVETAQDVQNKREDIPYVKDKTPTSGNEVTVMQQLLGNMGRFNSADTGQKGHHGAN
jgi:outer membrane protein assembly factor BamE (lipoprotein component of BamABCDE complex)